MKALLVVAALGLFANLHAAESGMPQGTDPESTLARVEFRISRLSSGRAQLLAGIAAMKPSVRQIACKAFPSSAEAIALINKDIAHLEEKEVAAELSEEQKARLSAQKAQAASLSPKPDCSQFQ